MMADQLTLPTGYSTAVISECGRYRYELIRRWGDDPMLEFVMLNPSTADADTDDPTIRRCIGFAKRWGYGALLVRNLYALRATNPEALLTYSGDAFGPKNADYLANNIAHCTIVGWGAHAAALEWFAAAAASSAPACTASPPTPTGRRSTRCTCPLTARRSTGSSSAREALHPRAEGALSRGSVPRLRPRPVQRR